MVSLYLSNKQIFAKMAQRVVNATAPPNEMVDKLTNLSDLIYLTQLMEVKIKTENKFDRSINLDMHNYIIMRKDIQPIWNLVIAMEEHSQLKFGKNQRI